MTRHLALLLLTACTVFAAVAASAGDAAPAAPVLMGDGAHKYQWVPGWAKLPDNVKLGGTHGCVMVDSQDRIYVNTEGEYAVIVFDAAGNFIKGWGKDYRVQAHGMFLAKEGDKEVIWLAHFGRHEVIKFTLDGDVLMTIPWPEKSGVYTKKDEFKPTSVTEAPNGDIYVADGYGKGWVHRFDAKGELIKSWDGHEGAAGKFSTPHGVGIDTRSQPARVVVADRANHRLQIFDLEGKYLDQVPGLRLPCKCIFRGDDLVVPDLQGRVTIFDKDFKVVTQLGDNSDPAKRGKYDVPPDQFKDGEFTAPHGANWDSQGNLYVEDWNKTGRVSKLLRVK